MGAAALELENSKCFCCCHLLYYISKSKVYNRRALIRGSVNQSRKKWASENVTFSGCRFSHCVATKLLAVRPAKPKIWPTGQSAELLTRLHIVAASKEADGTN